MKKVVFPFIGAAIIIGAIVFNISIGLRSDSLSNLALANVEALARSEVGDACGGCSTDCPGSKCCILQIGTVGYSLFRCL